MVRSFPSIDVDVPVKRAGLAPAGGCCAPPVQTAARRTPAANMGTSKSRFMATPPSRKDLLVRLNRGEELIERLPLRGDRFRRARQLEEHRTAGSFDNGAEETVAWHGL